MGLIAVALSILTVREVRLGRKPCAAQPPQPPVEIVPATGALEKGTNSSLGR